MGYLFSQTFIWLLLAFLLGLFLGWLLRGIMCRDEESSASSAESMAAGSGAVAAASVSEPATASVSEEIVAPEPEPVDSVVTPADTIQITDDMRPVSLAAPNGVADDLKRIKGVGPVIQDTLNELGIYHFQQIADFSADNEAWVDNHIAFPGRIGREGWVSQAVDLVEGVKTEFSERYDRGEVGEKNPNRKD